MQVRIIVHGIVQGVGYRSFVRRVARIHGITGSVRNVSDGSVEIIASGSDASLKDFEKDIKISGEYGPQVFKVERVPHIADKDDEVPNDDFVIKNDRTL